MQQPYQQPQRRQTQQRVQTPMLTREQAMRNAKIVAQRRRKKRRRKMMRFATGVLILILLLIIFLLWRDKTSQPLIFEPPFTENIQQEVAQTHLADNPTILSTEMQAPYALQTVAPYTVAVDAGHGGFDTGAQGVIDEIEMTEPTAQALYDWLMQDPNYNPVFCRALGEGSSVSDRAVVSNTAKASLLISIHGNSDSDSDSHGFECFPQPPGRLYHEQAYTFASLIAQGMQAQGARIRGETGVRYAYYVPNGDNYTKKIADSSDDTVRSEVTFGVVEKTYCPAVLVEQCFVTSWNDVDKFADADGCVLSARVYYEAICAYFGTVPIAQ